jgi:nucleotide-binding universal stress UspA family protein
MFTKVVVGVDGREGGRDAIGLAKQLSGRDSELLLAHVYGAGLISGLGVMLTRASGLEDSRRLLERESELASPDPQLVPSAERSISRGLRELAEDQEADLLVVGSSRRGIIGRVFLGDDTTRALNGAPCAVAIAPQGYGADGVPPLRIGVGYDGSPESEQAIDAAKGLAAAHGSRVKALAVVSMQSIPYGEPIPSNWPDIAKRLVDDECRTLAGLGDIEGDATYGEPGEALAEFSGELDLLIVGSRSNGPIGRLLNGSTSTYLARRASCPLLVLPRSAGR